MKCVPLVANNTNDNDQQHIEAFQELSKTNTTLKIEIERYKNVSLIVIHATLPRGKEKVIVKWYFCYVHLVDLLPYNWHEIKFFCFFPLSRREESCKHRLPACLSVRTSLIVQKRHFYEKELSESSDERYLFFIDV